jgi:hypothetical protein
MYCIVAREKIPNYHYLALCMYLLMEAGMEGGGVRGGGGASSCRGWDSAEEWLELRVLNDL